MKKIMLIFLSILFIASGANATLLTNGNFDDGASLGLASGEWGVYNTIPGWTKMDGTAGIEVQRSTIVGADTGEYYIELDSHAFNGETYTNSAMYQSVYLDLGTYELSWMYHARTNNGGDDNGIKSCIVTTEGSLIGSISKTLGEMNSTWEEVNWRFDIASAGCYKLYFAAYGLDNTLGGFIDSVELNPVPEPATLILLGSGLAGLAFYRRKRK